MVDHSTARRGEEVICTAAAPGGDKQRHDEQRADDLHRLRCGEADEDGEGDGDGAGGHAGGAGHIRIGGGKEHGPPEEADGGDDDDRGGG